MSELIAALEKRRVDAQRRSDNWQRGFRQSNHRLVHPTEETLLIDLAIAAEQAGPWPTMTQQSDGSYVWYSCDHCCGESYSARKIEHDSDCAGIAIRNALAALSHHLRSDATTAQDGAGR